MMTPITDERVIQVARRFCQYEAASKVVTLRGPGILEFARALLVEVEAQHVAELLAIRDDIDGVTPKREAQQV